MAHHVDARYDESDGSFLPPLRTLGFNPQLKLNDSLLVHSYIEAYDISYPEALRRIEAEVRELRQHLEADRQYELNDIGILRINDEGKLEFEPCEAGILTPQLYGLSSFEMPRLQKEQPKVAAVSQPAGTIQTTAHGDSGADAITIKLSWLRNLVAAAAAIIAFFMIGTPVTTDNRMLQSTVLPISTTSGSAVTSQTSAVTSQTVAPAATQAPETVAEAPAVKQEPAVKKSESHYSLVLASQVSQRNAEAFVQQLVSSGFNEASIYNSKTMRRVVYGSFATEDEAYAALHQLRNQNQSFKQAWVMRVKGEG